MSRRWIPGIEKVPAFDYGSRGYFEPTVVVLHFTGGGPVRQAIEALTAKDDRYVSAHIVIGRAGDRAQLVPFDRAAYHAGVSEWRYKGETRGAVNRYSIGIELANHGRLSPDPQVAGGFRYRAGGTMLPYSGPDPVAAELVFDNGKIERAWWEPYPEAQLVALEVTLAELPAFDDLVGHEEIAMPLGRKVDPGPRFPWERFGRSDGTRRTLGRLVDPDALA